MAFIRFPLPVKRKAYPTSSTTQELPWIITELTTYVVNYREGPGVFQRKKEARIELEVVAAR